MKARHLFLLLLSTSCIAAVGEEKEQPVVRRVPALEDATVTWCVTDNSKSWLTWSKTEQRALYTPAFYEQCSSGTQVWHLFPCCAADQTYTVIHSTKQLESYFDRIVGRATRSSDFPAGREWIAGYIKKVEQHVDFDDQVLVLSSTPYGPTGMAKASIEFEQQDRLLKAVIRIVVPPPPLTPDTTLFRFAFAVSRAEIDRVEITSGLPAVPDLGVKASSPAPAGFSITSPDEWLPR